MKLSGSTFAWVAGLGLAGVFASAEAAPLARGVAPGRPDAAPAVLRAEARVTVRVLAPSVRPSAMATEYRNRVVAPRRVPVVATGMGSTRGGAALNRFVLRRSSAPSRILVPAAVPAGDPR